MCPTSDEPCVATKCGDGIVEPSEACDDGNDASDDGCSDCAIEPGWSCTVVEAEGDAGVGPFSECTSVCGDGVLSAAEECDNGVMNGDGACSLDCTLE